MEFLDVAICGEEYGGGLSDHTGIIAVEGDVQSKGIEFENSAVEEFDPKLYEIQRSELGRRCSFDNPIQVVSDRHLSSPQVFKSTIKG